MVDQFWSLARAFLNGQDVPLGSVASMRPPEKTE
jgi:hypothetical protein